MFIDVKAESIDKHIDSPSPSPSAPFAAAVCLTFAIIPAFINYGQPRPCETRLSEGEAHVSLYVYIFHSEEADLIFRRPLSFKIAVNSERAVNTHTRTNYEYPLKLFIQSVISPFVKQ